MPLKTILQNILFYSILVPVTVFIALTSILTIIFPRKISYWYITLWCRFFIFWAKTVCGIQYQVTGLENLPQGPAVVIANHQSVWETVFLQMILPQQSWVLRKTLLYIPFFGWGLWLLKPITVNRRRSGNAALVRSQALQRLKEDKTWVVIFPEGTRMSPGDYKKFSKTGSHIAFDAECPLVPISHNAGTYWPKGFLFQKSGIIQVHIAPPITPGNFDSVEECNDAIERQIRQQLAFWSTENNTTS